MHFSKNLNIKKNLMKWLTIEKSVHFTAENHKKKIEVGDVFQITRMQKKS